MGSQCVNDLNWTKGLNPKTRKPLGVRLDVQICNPPRGLARRPR
jgi:hypothetical protein